MKSYIDNISWKCLLGPQSKNIYEHNEIFFWDVGKRKHFVTNRILTEKDIPLLAGRSFHYLSEENLLFIKNMNITLTKDRNISTILNITDLSFIGNKFKSLRHAFNRGASYNFTIENNYRNFTDVKRMINEWSNTLAIKYFRDNSGKNAHFYKNNWHIDCHNVFIYNGDELVSFGTVSNNKPYASYILGKALCNRYYGLSEFTDIILYRKCLAEGIDTIDMGQTTGGLLHYKNKFPNSSNYTYFNGKIL